MSQKTVYGIPIASPEQQKRTALVILAIAVLILGGAAAAFILPAAITHYTYAPATGTVAALDRMCHYQVQRFNKRGPAELTGLVDCLTAMQEAERVDHAMGRVVEVAVVTVDFATAEGAPAHGQMILPREAASDLEAGSAIDIEYDPENPGHIQRRAKNLFALTHAGRFGLDEEAAAPAPAAMLPGAVKPKAEPSETVKTISWYIACVIVGAILVAPFVVLRWLWVWFRRRRNAAGSGPVTSPTARHASATARGLATTPQRRSF